MTVLTGSVPTPKNASRHHLPLKPASNIPMKDNVPLDAMLAAIEFAAKENQEGKGISLVDADNMVKSKYGWT